MCSDDREGQALALRCAGIFSCVRAVARDRPSRYGVWWIFACDWTIARGCPRATACGRFSGRAGFSIKKFKKI